MILKGVIYTKMGDHYVNGYVTSGSYFIYKGVRYGQRTQILFTEEFYKRVGEFQEHPKNVMLMCGWKYPYFRVFNSIVTRNGKEVWRCGEWYFSKREYVDVDPERDIEKIVIPVWYLEPKELVKLRLKNGTWINYIFPQTLFYVFCLIASLVTYDWYKVWIIGTYIYLRTSYITLSKGELNRGW